MATVTELSKAARSLVRILNNHLGVLNVLETTILDRIKTDLSDLLREDSEAEIVNDARAALNTKPTTRQELIDAINALS